MLKLGLTALSTLTKLPLLLKMAVTDLVCRILDATLEPRVVREEEHDATA